MRKRNRIVPCLDLSTDHLTRRDATLLAQAAANEVLSVLQATCPTSAGWYLKIGKRVPKMVHPFPTLSVSEDCYGFVMRLSLDQEYLSDKIAELENLGFSSSFIGIFKHAVKMRCWYIRFDCDAEYLEGFPVFEW